MIRCTICGDVITPPEDGSMVYCQCRNVGISFKDGTRLISGNGAGYEEVAE